jgi:hypothetical protein
MVYKADATGKLHKFQRYHYALRVSFVSTGTIGKPDVFATLTNLAVVGLYKCVLFYHKVFCHQMRSMETDEH